jgi:2-(1,2-epoxy-1,2-dihydrophenyl)acetyl-CoA isomerase
MTESDAAAPVLVTRENGLAILTLNRPEAYNAMNLDLGQALLEALIDCDEDADVRAVMITGAGAAFCAGGDIRAMRASADADGRAGPFLKRLTVYVHGLVATMARMPKPVIGAINGAAAGAGMSLALACDLLVAAEGARFTMAYTKIGIAPDGSSTFFLPRLVGAKRAYELIARNRPLSAAEAQALGIVNQIYADDSFAAHAKAYAAELAAGPTQALGHAKRLLTMSPGSPLETQMEYERQAIAACGNSADFAEGTMAFLEKRAPAFTGK